MSELKIQVSDTVNKIIPSVLLEDYEIVDIIKGELSKEFQNRFNKNLDYDNWCGIEEFLETCGKNINVKINELIELNKQALINNQL